MWSAGAKRRREGAGGGRSRLLRQAALLAREVAHCRVRPEGSVAARYMPKPLRGIDIPVRDAPSLQVAIVGVVVYDHCPTSEPQSGHDLRAVVKIQVRSHNPSGGNRPTGRSLTGISGPCGPS